MYWELAQNGQFTDFKIVEESTTGETREYTVHKLVIYKSSEYLQRLLDSNMSEVTNNCVTIKTESPELGVINVVLEAMYSTNLLVKGIYWKYCDEDLHKLMYVYLLLHYLQSDTHLEMIDELFDKFETFDLIKWWKVRIESGNFVPPGFEQKLRDRVKDCIFVNIWSFFFC